MLQGKKKDIAQEENWLLAFYQAPFPYTLLTLSELYNFKLLAGLTAY